MRMPPSAWSSFHAPATHHCRPSAIFLSDNLMQVAETKGPRLMILVSDAWASTPSRTRRHAATTGPYVFFATRQPGCTFQHSAEGGHRGVVAADLLLNRLEVMLDEQGSA